MTKFIVLLVVVAAAVSSIKAEQNYPNVPGFPFQPFKFGNGFAQAWAPLALLNPDYIKNLKPGPGQKIAGASVSSSSSTKTENGVTKKESAGRVVTNQDGKVTDVSF